MFVIEIITQQFSKVQNHPDEAIKGPNHLLLLCWDYLSVKTQTYFLNYYIYVQKTGDQ